jgi:hypothetical protein
VILFLLILLLSVLLPAIQYQKWQTAMNYLKHTSLQNLSLKAGGTKQTIEIHRRARERYDEIIAGHYNPPLFLYSGAHDHRRIYKAEREYHQTKVFR